MSDYKEIPRSTEMQKLLNELLKRHPKIVQTSECMGGQPRLNNHRMRVTDFLANMACYDWSPSQMVDGWGPYPEGEGFTTEDVKDVLRYAYDMVNLVWDKSNGRDYGNKFSGE